MNSIRFVEAALNITFDQITADKEGFEEEFNTLSDLDNDAIGQWLKAARVKGDINDSDPVIVNLMVELYRKMDRLENLIAGVTPEQSSLTYNGKIIQIGLEHFELSEPLCEAGEHYYGRIELPVLPRRQTPIFFEALSPTLVKITRIHLKDENEWSIYMTARERAMIRQLKGW